MGATIPLGMFAIRRDRRLESQRSFSFLYLANVLGAVAGSFVGFAPGIVHHANGQANFLTNFLLPFIILRVMKLAEDGRWLRNGIYLGLLVAYQVFLNGVPQRLGADYTVREGALVFERELRKDKISGWRWLLGAWGVGTYRQDDSVDVRYEAADGSPRVAEALEIEAG